MRLIVLLVVLVAGCGTTDPAEHVTIQVQGTVTLASAGTPIAGVTVGVSWKPCPSGPFQHCFPDPDPYFLWDPDVEVTSDAAGHYAFSYQVPGPFSASELPVRVSCGGLQDFDRTAGGLRYTEEVQTLDFQLEPTFPHAELYSVWGTSSDDIYVVGSAGDYRRAAIGHSDGATWSAMLNRTADGRSVLCGVDDGLSDVWGTSSSDVFAVADLTIVHYDGTSWNTMVDWPSSAGPTPSVWGLSSTDVYAAGGSHIMHYDGTSWNTVADSTSWVLSGVWGTAAQDIYAVGNPVLHFDGATWTVMLSGMDWNLNAMWGTSSSDVYAVGRDWVTDAGLILHYDGSEWNAMTSGTDVDLVGVDLRDVWGSSSTDIFAVGYHTILHYDGEGWNTMADRLGESWNTMADSLAWELSSVWGSAPSDVYAVGSDWSSGDVGLILHYDGSEWTRIPLY